MNDIGKEKYRDLRAAAARERWLSGLMRLFLGISVSSVVVQLAFEDMGVCQKVVYVGLALVISVIFVFLDRMFYLMSESSQVEAEILMYGDNDANNSNSAKMEE